MEITVKHKLQQNDTKHNKLMVTNSDNIVPAKRGGEQKTNIFCSITPLHKKKSYNDVCLHVNTKCWALQQNFLHSPKDRLSLTSNNHTVREKDMPIGTLTHNV